jgi:hypothetical protein
LRLLAVVVLRVVGIFISYQTSESNTGTGPRGLVHLTEDQSDLGLAIKLNDGGLLHFVVQIVTLTGTLTDTSEHGETTMGLGNVVLKPQLASRGKQLEMAYNQLLNEHSLSDTGTSEKTNLPTTSVGGQKIDDLDTSNEHLGGGRLLGERWGIGVNGTALVALDGTTLVNGVTSDVHDATEGSVSNGNGDWGARIGGLVASDKTFGTYFHHH